MKVFRSPKSIQRASISADARPIVVVPTMGNLHEGHLSLIRKARTLAGENGLVLVTIFVNKTQFGPREDFKKYPRTLKEDLAHCRQLGVDIVFAPDDEAMYGGDHSTFVSEERLAKRMEGASRPTHFRGVTTVVAKLFNLTQPDIAVFGAKDWQQTAVISRMVDDLNFPVRIVTAPTIREPDGLAMSSRNRYLKSAERAEATVLVETLRLAKRLVRTAKSPIGSAALGRRLEKQIATKRLAKLDYIEFFDPKTLEPAERIRRGTHMALAVFFGKTRLIDNGRL